jgi:hypothetical protein
MPLKLKSKTYKSTIRLVAMYGSVCWAMKKKDERKLHVAEIRMLRWMFGVTRMDIVTDYGNTERESFELVWTC